MGIQTYSERLIIASEKKIKEKNYWHKKLAGDWEKSVFPYDHKKNNLDKSSPGMFKFKFSNRCFSRLTKLSKGMDPALHIILMAGVMLLYNKYTGIKDIIIGTPIYRQETDADLINTVLVIRNQLQTVVTFKELLLKMKQVYLEASEHQNYPVEVLAEQLNKPVVPGDNYFSLFDISVLLTNLHDKKYLGHIKHNITFSFHKTSAQIEGELEYNKILYRESTLKRIIGYLENLLQAAISNPETPLQHIEMASEQDKAHILYDFNGTREEYPSNKTLQELFEEQVELTPANTAVVYEGEHLTYRQLNETANQLARILRRKGVSRDHIVGIMVNHGLEMITGILGILKAGGAFLPIDADYPLTRVQIMLNESGASILLAKIRVLDNVSFVALQELRSSRQEILVTTRRPQVTDFDRIGIPDRSLVDYEKYSRFIGITMFKNVLTIQASRGCPYNCMYCHKIWPKTHVVRSAENIMEEVRAFYRMGVKRFSFLDDIFNLNFKNSTRFFRMILEQKMDIQLCFSSGLRGDLLTREYIDLLIEAGTVALALALETGSPRLQKVIGKNMNIEKLREVVDYICEKYPQVILELQTMHGFPTETEEEAMMTLDFIKNSKWIHFPYIHILKIYPGTDMASFARESGISYKAIENSLKLAFHELPETLPFDRSFTLNVQTDYFNSYLLSKQRLLHVLPHQLRVMTPDEMVQKYNNFFPTDIKSLHDIFKFVGVSQEDIGMETFLDEDAMSTPSLNEKIKGYFSPPIPAKDALKVLLLDLSQFFSKEKELHDEGKNLFYETSEPPLGLMFLLTALNKAFGSRINGKIAKSRVDFDSYAQLKALLVEFAPKVIGIRTLSFYMDFFHTTVSMVRQWGFEGVMVSGGPYATSDYNTLLQDKNVDLVVLGEGEETFTQLVGTIMENDGKLPGKEVLAKIAGLAFVSEKTRSPWAQTRDILMLDEAKEISAAESGENPRHINQPTDLAYCIFTSGSTGKPKGVLIEHRSLGNLCGWHNRYYSVTLHDRATKYAGFGFDASVWEIFPYLVKGASLYIIPDTIRLDIEGLNWYFEKNDITIGFLPTRICELFAKLDNSSLRLLLTGGDKLEQYKKNNYQLVNNYGPTENTVVATSFFVHEAVDNIPIGKPIFNAYVYVLDRNHHLQTIGVPGELCVSGDGLARGYINSPLLTAEKFIKIELKVETAEEKGGKRQIHHKKSPGKGIHMSHISHMTYMTYIYKTGDLARWLPDGNIEYLGRLDHQVKIRGFRIELGEIESLLLTHTEIREVVVLAREGRGEKYLSAYFTANNDIPPAQLIRYLSKRLPGYMIPTYLVQLERLPLTTSGKVDRKALEHAGTRNEVEYTAPGTETEKIISRTWKEILQLDKVSIHANFFDLGGSSLDIIKVNDKLKVEMGRDISVVEILKNPTIHSFAKYLSSKEENTPVIPGEQITETVDLMEETTRLFIGDDND